MTMPLHLGHFLSKTSLTDMQAYSVTKAAQLHLVKTLAAISGPHIRVNSVSPGLLLTVSRLKSVFGWC